jgi:kynurenine formamidase
LLDVAKHRGVSVIEPGAAFDADELRSVAAEQKSTLRTGDVVLIRTGWAQNWNDPYTFNGGGGGFPGPDSDGARWLVDSGAVIVGSDTPVFEASPFPKDSVHAMLLVDRGIHILENLYLEQIAQDQLHEFLFVGLPLRISGGTGSPLRPIAVA